METVLALVVMVVSLAVGLGRFAVPGHDLTWAGSYEAMAHIWVGALITITCYEPHSSAGHLAFIYLVTLTMLETYMFLTRNKPPELRL